MSLAAGSRVGAYEVIALIGMGGMGEVYRARYAAQSSPGGELIVVQNWLAQLKRPQQGKASN